VQDSGWDLSHGFDEVPEDTELCERDDVLYVLLEEENVESFEDHWTVCGLDGALSVDIIGHRRGSWVVESDLQMRHR
jgi:hypothetical protein